MLNRNMIKKYGESANISLNLQSAEYVLSLKRDETWLGWLPIITDDTNESIGFGKMRLIYNSNTNKHELHLYSIDDTWLCNFESK